jgi:hypothetical protein
LLNRLGNYALKQLWTQKVRVDCAVAGEKSLVHILAYAEPGLVETTTTL